MSSSVSMKTVLVTGSILSLASQALGHMELSWPYPLHSKYNPANSYQNIDYSMTSPLVADGSNFPCKGYQNDRPITPVITYQAGSTYNITLAGSATHGGGSCQLSLSYDNGATFRVIKSIIGGCPLTSTYDFTLPSYVPNGDALFAWTWQNEQGNREFYMNCAEVAIQGSSSSKRDTTSFESLPFIWKANLAGINTCATIEGEDPVYPMPGPQVEYGGSMSSSSAASSQAGVCDAATPFGQTYEDLGDTEEPQTATAGSGAAAATTVKTSSSKAASTSTKAATTLQSTTSSSKASSASTKASTAVVQSSSASAASSSKQVTLSTVNAGKTVTSTSAAPASTASPDDGDDGDDDEGDECADVTLTVYASTNAATTSVVKASSTASSAAASTSTSVIDSEYATGNLTTYLPCVPGTYICTSASAWVTCDQTMYSDGSTAWVYEESRSLGNGAVCVPSFSPYSSSNKQYSQQADAPSGYYRDDRIAYSTGQACTEDGDIECVSSSEFDMCADAVWYQMGAVASGTTCTNGQLVVS